jgi:hypothetical protein
MPQATPVRRLMVMRWLRIVGATHVHLKKSSREVPRLALMHLPTRRVHDPPRAAGVAPAAWCNAFNTHALPAARALS